MPLSAVVHYQRGLSPLAVFHSQSFPSSTVSFNLLPNVPLSVAAANIQRAVEELHMPEGIRGSFDGNAGDFNKSSGHMPLLILGALVAMYIVLGVLYESLAHPLTIISTLPSAGLGALLALQVTNTPLTVIAFVGIILLIGIVKKNGIMMVDFALDAERNRGLSSADAIFEACSARFRPILMTTMAALFAGIPLVIATGPGTELRRPLGITIIGGLLVSQILTLYTTPVIYLLIDRLRRPVRSLPRSRRPQNSFEPQARAAYSGRMSKQAEPATGAAIAEPIPDCPHCHKPLPLCICDSITPIENRISLLILQHPQEQDRALGTARLTALHFKDAVLKIGLSWPSLSKALGRPVHDPSRWAVLYLGSAKVADLDTDSRHRRHQPQGRDRGPSARHPERHRRHRAARRHLEPGQGAVVAQCVDAEMPARHPRPEASLALRQAAPRAAPRRPVHHRGGGDAALHPRKAAGYRRDAAWQFRADAGEIPRGASHAARTRAETAAKAGLSPPQRLIVAGRRSGETVGKVEASGSLGCLSAGGRIRVRPHGATWRSGYATVCKTVYTSSILVVASNSTSLTSQHYLA